MSQECGEAVSAFQSADKARIREERKDRFRVIDGGKPDTMKPGA